MPDHLDPSQPGSLYEPICGTCRFVPDDEQEAAEKATLLEIEDIGCQELARWEIEDQLVRDPYTKTTHACVDHVGRLLGHSVDISAEVAASKDWLVRPVEVECKACAMRLPWFHEILVHHAELVQKRSDGSLGTCAEFWAAATAA